MKKYISHWIVGRESRASTYFGILFGTAVFTILAIRAFLAVTGFPQLGGDSLHIAHMLWGGLFMLVSIITLLYLHGHRAKITGAFIGGIGFGFFIDELGKFITKDNDYFYQPAAMLIYIIFILLWALLSWLDNYVPSTPRQHYIDLLTRIRDAAVHGLTPEDKIYIAKCTSELGIHKKEQVNLLGQIEKYSPTYQPGSLVRVTHNVVSKTEQATNALIKNKVTPFVTYIVITISAFASLALFILAILNKQDALDIGKAVPLGIELGILVSTALTIAAVLVGFTYSRSNWKKTLTWYKRAMLVNVFGTQVFLFYVNQFTAVFGLAFSLLFLYVLTIQLNAYEAK